MTRIIEKLAAYLAVLGGITLTVLIVLTCVSIFGRAFIGFGLNAIPGDYELVEVGIAFAVFCFMPYCQVTSGHARVDIFTSALGPSANRYIIAFWEIILTAVIILIAWRLYFGFTGKLGNGSTSMLLQFPIWWAYAATLVPAFVGVVIGVWSAFDKVWAAVTGREPSATLSEKVH